MKYLESLADLFIHSVRASIKIVNIANILIKILPNLFDQSRLQLGNMIKNIWTSLIVKVLTLIWDI